MRALIGHTGFVGSNLLRAGGFDATFNSRNFRDIAGRRFDEVVCAGVSAAKWIAAREPEADRAAIAALTSVLEKASIGRFVLISTIDVYPDPSLGLDESFDPAGLPNHPYGTHRHALETWVRARYPDHLVVRLPALFGPGLKKNALFDLLNDNQVATINPAAVYQWYPVERLAADIASATSAGLRLVNLFTAPLAMSRLVDAYFPRAAVGPERLPAPHYALTTRHAALFGGKDGYILTAHEELHQIGGFIAACREGAR